jgi:hypothetical protein
MPFIPLLAHQAGLPEEAVHPRRVGTGPEGEVIAQGEIGFASRRVRRGVACKEGAEVAAVAGRVGFREERGIIALEYEPLDAGPPTMARDWSRLSPTTSMSRAFELHLRRVESAGGPRKIAAQKDSLAAADRRIQGAGIRTAAGGIA